MAIFTEMELRISELLLKGFSNKEIAEELNISLSTAKVYVSNLISKLNAKNRTHLAVLIIKNEILNSIN